MLDRGIVSDASEYSRIHFVTPLLFLFLTRPMSSLAYAEMRLILARVIFNFDMRLADDSKGWMERQKIYLLWEKSPLNVFLAPAAA